MGYENPYPAVLILQRHYPGFDMCIRPKDNSSKERMCSIAREATGWLLLLIPAERRAKGILLRYPLDLPTEAVQAHPT